jgi:hypothetical protein
MHSYIVASIVELDLFKILNTQNIPCMLLYSY